MCLLLYHFISLAISNELIDIQVCLWTSREELY